MVIWLGKRGLKMAFCGNCLGRNNWDGDIVTVRLGVNQEDLQQQMGRIGSANIGY